MAHTLGNAVFDGAHGTPYTLNHQSLEVGEKTFMYGLLKNARVQDA
jgi:hypothetical protein